MKNFILFIILILISCISAFAQSKFPELDKIKQLKLLESTREEIKKIFDDDDEDSDGERYRTEDVYIEFSYSDGDCSAENGEEWNVPENKVTEITVTFNNSAKPQDFKINLSKLERIDRYANEEDAEYENDEDAEYEKEYIYYEKEKGISYGVWQDKIYNIKFIPTKENYPALCNNEKVRQFNSNEEWFQVKLRKRPTASKDSRPFADVTNVTLSKREIKAECITEASPKGQVCSKDAFIEVETKVKSDDPTDVLIYSYTISGGTIIGTGANVTWDLSGVKPGEYKIMAGIDEGCPFCGQTKTEVVVVKESPANSLKLKEKDLP